MRKKLLLSAIVAFSFIDTQAQRYDWLSRASVNVSNYYEPVAVDPAGNIYTLIGTTSSGAVIQGDTIACLTAGDGVVISKFDPAGNFLWASMVNPDAGVLYGEKIAVDNTGAVYASINFPNGGTVHLIDTSFIPGGGAAGVIIKLDSSGHFIHAMAYVNMTAPRIACLGTDIYAGHGYSVSKLDSALNTIWTVNDPTNTIGFDYSAFNRADISVNSQGELISSVIEWNNPVGPVPFGNDTVHFSAGGFDEVGVIKMDTSGNVLWTKALSLRTSGLPDVRAVVMDSHGNAYLGFTAANAQVIFATDTLENTIGSGAYCGILKWDSAGTPVKGTGIYPFSSQPSILDLAVNAQDELLVSGTFGTGSLSIDGITNIPGYNNFFLFKFNATGNFAWYKDNSSILFSGSSADGIAVRNGNEYILAGSVLPATTFQFGCIAFTSPGNENFVTLISEQPELYPVAAFTFNVTNDTSFAFIDQSQNATAWHWDFGNGDTSNLQNPVRNFVLGANYTIILTAFHGACYDTDTFLLLSVGIEDVASSDIFSISPNPSSGHFILSAEYSKNASVEIMDVLGHVVYKNENIVATQTEIDLEGMSPGIYFANMQVGEKRLSRKLILVRD